MASIPQTLTPTYQTQILLYDNMVKSPEGKPTQVAIEMKAVMKLRKI